MISKKIINSQRIRRIDGGFSFIPHRFLTDGFLSSLNQKELLLYFFLILASDRYGLSFYCYDVVCSYLELCVEDYIKARDGLIEKDLIAFDGSLFQVLDLPESPVQAPPMKAVPAPTGRGHHSEIQALIQQSLWEAGGG
ncbi:MAG: hypothetical protein ABII26_07105 [Pseudomonadota bacterium]